MDSRLEPSAQPFVAWLEDLIASRGVSWRQFACGAAVSPSALSALRTGRVGRPSMETCYRIARYLGLDPRYVQRLGGHELEDQGSVDPMKPGAVVGPSVIRVRCYDH